MKTLHHVPETRSRARSNRSAGFSLAELMVVIVIIGLLATVVVPNLMSKFGTAQIGKAKADITNIEQQVTAYQIDNVGRLPESLEVLVTEDDKGTKYLNMDVVPKDPWGNEYIYEITSSDKFLIWSYGQDGVQGGEGKDADFNNKMIRNGEV